MGADRRAPLRGSRAARTSAKLDAMLAEAEDVVIGLSLDTAKDC